ncbi:MAG: aminotransferase class I/II-fold pyridoxal phosphate-dependent enzyme [Candidatus Kapabacteria bacterium]|nr:aminotransferase class I/II-fold pyridoxal phosphate-dependent enzyme [Candidatus Kapabacteria bacterium]
MISVNPHLHSTSAYTPGASPEQIKAQYGLDDVQKLASNENPLGCSPLATAAATGALRHVNLYNDGGEALRERLAAFHDVTSESISVHNGSDAIIHQIMRTFLLPGQTALSSEGTFVSFRLAVAGADRQHRLVRQRAGYRFDVAAIVDAVDETTKVIYIANPNNPTGTLVDASELGALLEQVPASVLVVLDEAYIEYARHLHPEMCASDAMLSRPNVIRLRTFSKAYGLAALRIGYAVGDPDVLQWLRRTKLPFDPNGIGCSAAIAALDDQEFVQRTVSLNAECLRIMKQVAAEAGLAFAEPSANFLMIDLGTEQNATRFHRDLLQGGFISRPLAGFGLPTCVRISTGTIDQITRLADVITSSARRLSSSVESSPILVNES